MRLSDRSRGLTVGVLVTVAFVAAALIGAWVGHVIETRNAEVATQTDQKEAVTDAYVAVNDRCAESDGCVPGPPAAEVIRGAAGVPGDRGPQGDRGTAGTTGERGPRGERGEAGPMGPPGRPGVDGANGVDGVNGIDGQPGAQGPAGPQGETGATGPQGEAGPKGVTGDPGTPGVDGQTCPAGSQLAAVTYASGETGYGCVVPASVKNSGRQERQ